LINKFIESKNPKLEVQNINSAYYTTTTTTAAASLHKSAALGRDSKPVGLHSSVAAGKRQAATASASSSDFVASRRRRPLHSHVTLARHIGCHRSC